MIHACNPARSHLPDRPVLQDFRRQELRLRPSRRQPGILRGKVRPAGLPVAALAARGKAHLQGRRYLHRHERVLSPHRHRARGNAAGARFRGPLRSKSRPRQEASPRSRLAQRPPVPRRLCGRDQPIRGSRFAALSDQPRRLRPRPPGHSIRGGRQRPGAGGNQAGWPRR